MLRCPAQPGTGSLSDKTAQSRHGLTGNLRQGVGGGVADQAGQVFFGIPAHMVDQPIDFGGQLHIAFDADLGFVAPRQRRSQRNGGFFSHREAQIKAFKMASLKQACRGRTQLKLHAVPNQFDALAFLAGQTGHGLGLAHQHMVEEQNQSVEGLIDHPSRGLEVGREPVDHVGERLSGP